MKNNAARSFHTNGNRGEPTTPKLHSTISEVSTFTAPGNGERFVVIKEHEFHAMHESLELAEAIAIQSLVEAAIEPAIEPATQEIVGSARHSGSAVTYSRELSGISLRQLAARTGLDEHYVAGIEDGSRRPTLSAICKIAKVLNTTVDELIQD